MKYRIVGQVEGVEYELLHISQVSKMLGYSERWTRQLCDEGKLIAFKIGGSWFAYPQLIAFIPQTDSQTA